MMSKFSPFVDAFGSPAPGTGVPLDELGLSQLPGLVEFQEEVGGGTFLNGAFSLFSKREAYGLAEWGAVLPGSFKLYGSSAIGILLATNGETDWVINTQNGELIESGLNLVDMLDVFIKNPNEAYTLRKELFDSWIKHWGSLAPDCFLCPTPVPIMGGLMGDPWSIETMKPMSAPVFLSFTAQNFGPQGFEPLEYAYLS